MAELLCTLSLWQEQRNQIGEALINLQQALDIYMNLYGAEDQRSCKVKRNIALIYLRGN